MKYILFLCLFLISPLFADENALPEKVFPADRYQTLWTKSPFIVATVATPDGPAQAPSQYKLVGVSRFSGIGYANIVDSSTPGAPGIFLEQYKLFKHGDKTLVLIGIEPGKPGQKCVAHITEDGKVIDIQTEPTGAGGSLPATLSNVNTPPGGFQPPMAPPLRPRPPSVIIKVKTNVIPNQPTNP